LYTNLCLKEQLCCQQPHMGSLSCRSHLQTESKQVSKRLIFISHARSHRRRPLTSDVQHHGPHHLGLGVDLTLVPPPVRMSRRHDPQRPLVRVGRVHHLHPRVGRVRVRPRGQDVQVTLPYPRNLKHTSQGRVLIKRVFVSCLVCIFPLGI